MIRRTGLAAIVLIFAALLAASLSLPAHAAGKKDFDECQRPGDPNRGVAACTRVLADRSLTLAGSAAVFANRGNFYAAAGDFDRALADFDQAIRIAPNNPFTRNGRGNALRDKGEWDGALAEYSAAINLDPGNGKAYANRGQIWRLKGDLTRALADQNLQASLSPNDPFVYLARGDSYRYLGDFARALADFDRAQSLSPASSAPFTGRGLTYEKMGDAARAHAEFERAVAAPNPYRTGLDLSALQAAQARLAALDSGFAQPVIPLPPATASSTTSIPTPAARVPSTAPARVAQGRRVALVIGNAAYSNVPALANPQNDAQAVAASLRNVGFDSVTLANDTTREKLIDGLRSFAALADKADWAMVYYAGHGIEMNGQNYLIPVDAKLAVDRDVQFEAVPLEHVLAALGGATKLKLVMLDACRVNPFAPQMRRTEAVAAVGSISTAGGTTDTRSIGRGLGRVEVRSGPTLVVFAAKDGQTAFDGDGANSPFAVAMVQRIATPGVEINKIFRLVRDDVMEATAGRQEPYTYGSLPGKEDFFFVAK